MSDKDIPKITLLGLERCYYSMATSQLLEFKPDVHSRKTSDDIAKDIMNNNHTDTMGT